MSEWILGPDVLAHARFEVSHLAVAVAALGAVVATRSPDLRDIVAGDPVAAALVGAGVRPGWIADCFTVAVPAGACLADELGPVRSRPDDVVREDIATAARHAYPGAASGPGVVPRAVLEARGLGETVAGVLTRTWQVRVEHRWTALRRVLEADIVSRTSALRRDGWAAALEGMRPGTAYLGGGAVRISSLDLPPKHLADAHLSLHPVDGARSFVLWDLPARRFALTYPATGTGLSAGPRPPDALDRLVGANRATVLRLLATPASPTQVAARTGLPLGSVGRHLRILLDAGLVTRRRSGREVLYWRTPRGDDLTGA